MGDPMQHAMDVAARAEGHVADVRRELDGGRLGVADMHARELLNAAFQIRKAVIRAMEEDARVGATTRAEAER